ncbi:Eukaryotic translation initiation factor 2A [Stylophora pistillata]|uniref:Eukaryotic translation initiation factor 2A n=1 Tax=Stylophora pistillata TaxID=50429 RepID=A0A2B4RQC9_STYPI|nr:Eukaryotic translation initiation factor 2A [Stylophora pistillata]
MAATRALFAVRGSDGISIVHGPPKFRQNQDFGSDNSGRCTVMTFSADGSLFAWCNGQSVRVVDTSKFSLVCRIPKEKTQCLDFSPKSTHISTWEQYTASKDQSAGVNNLEIWNLQAGRLVAGFSQKKKDTWQPKWSEDESVCARSVTNEVHCFHNTDFTSIATKLRLQGISDFELSPGSPPLTVAAYVPGSKEMWSRKDLKLISKPQASDSTYFEWCPDGEHILTATTSPRLREGNGYKLWHYTGKLLDERSVDELWEVKWQPVVHGVFKEPRIDYSAAASATTQEQQKTKDVYRPPGLRGSAPSVKLHENEPAENMKPKEGQEMSKSAAKNKKKREAKARAKQEQEAAIGEVVNSKLPPPSPASPPVADTTTLPPEKEKKLRNLKKKLRQIEDLKEQQKSGKTLEKNQLDKVAAEASLIKEIQELELGS